MMRPGWKPYRQAHPAGEPVDDIWTDVQWVAFGVVALILCAWIAKPS